MTRFNNFFTSGWEIVDSSDNLKSKYQMLNIGLLLSSLGLIFGMISNYFKDDFYLIYIELFLLSINIMMFFILRVNKKYFNYILAPFTGQFALLFLFLMYISEPSAMKHVWLFTFPIIILFYKETKKALIWLSFLFSMILIAPFQPFIEIYYSFHQILYILFVVFIVALIMYTYKMKIDEAKEIILQQQNQLLGFNCKLSTQVELKTSQLQKINESLEVTVQEKIEELIQKDKLLTVQSKQAVMGEMISMIAHQWRQPLSSITLQISNLQFKKLLGEELNEEDITKTLSEISDTIIYLSETIDDFQTYFHPDKEVTEIKTDEVINKVLNFVLPRLKETKINISVDSSVNLTIKVYLNELIQVLLNILNNAIDALIESKRENPQIIFSVKERGENLLISINDNAFGIAPEIQKRIFEPYFSTKGENGTGLGLYMSQMIIQKQFNGKIDVLSSDRGTTFIISIAKNIS